MSTQHENDMSFLFHTRFLVVCQEKNYLVQKLFIMGFALLPMLSTFGFNTTTLLVGLEAGSHGK
jgi:hypothetical protein